MAVQVSPGVVINEVDLTTVVPGVDSSTGAIGGVFRWGPINTRILVDSETTLVDSFGSPTNFNPETFFSAAAFLAYTNSLIVVRAANTSGTSPILTAANVQVGNATVIVASTNALSNGMIVMTASNTSAIRVGTTISVINATAFSLATATDAAGTDPNVTLQFISNNASYSAFANVAAVANLQVQAVKSNDDFTAKSNNGNFDTNILYLAKWAGGPGNSLRISVCETSNQFSSNIDLTSAGVYSGNVVSTLGSNVAVVTLGANVSSGLFNVNTFNTFATSVVGSLTIGDYITMGNTVIGTQNVNITAITNTSLITLSANSSTTINASSSNTTVTTTGNAFVGLGNNTVLALFSNSTVYKTVFVSSFTDGNTAILSANAGITNNTITWATLASNTVTINLATNSIFKKSQNTSSTILNRAWEFYSAFDTAPGQSPYVLANGNTAANDEMHVIVVDNLGKFTKVPGTVLERYVGLSRANNALTITGDTNYFKTIINLNSKYIWAITDRAGASTNTALNIASSTNLVPLSATFNYGFDGADETAIDISSITNAYDQFTSTEDTDISLVIAGKSRGGVDGEQVANYLIDNIVGERKDCVVFISPNKSDVVSASGNEVTNCINFRNNLRSSSYAFLDSGYKYMYDKYNNVYRYVPLNGDIAGLAARTDSTNDPWWSFAGLNRGAIKNIVKLAWNPKQTYRDALYKNSINPVVTFNGDGTVLYGDKTLLAKPSSFDRINVRRLFLVLEKSISRAAKYSLFEFNDPFTRAQFRNLVTPFLNDVMGKRGITDFAVRCDGTNNSQQIINTNQFVGDIFIVANRSINYLKLNFISVNGNVSFTEAENIQF